MLELADGRVYSGQQALRLGLVDRLGTLHDAVMRAGELGGIKGEPRILERHDRSHWLRDLVFGVTHIPAVRALTLGTSPRLEYRFAW